MSILPRPADRDIRTAFAELTSLTYLKSGGFKHVYEATANGYREAFKLLSFPKSAPNPLAQQNRLESINRVDRELRLLQQNLCPELVRLGSLSPVMRDINGVDYLGYTEEFLDGPSVQDLIDAKRRPDQTQLVQLTTALVKAVEALWSKGYVHRDIKPLNILCHSDPARPFVLLDLGIAYDINEPGLTVNPANIPTTLPYMPPEMIDPKFRDNLDFRADLYAIGITVFEFASNSHPLQITNPNPIQTISRILKASPTKMADVRSDLDPRFSSLVDQLVKKKPLLRPRATSLIFNVLNSLS